MALYEDAFNSGQDNQNQIVFTIFKLIPGYKLTGKYNPILVKLTTILIRFLCVHLEVVFGRLEKITSAGGPIEGFPRAPHCWIGFSSIDRWKKTFFYRDDEKLQKKKVMFVGFQ